MTVLPLPYHELHELPISTKVTAVLRSYMCTRTAMFAEDGVYSAGVPAHNAMGGRLIV